jgi:hypothetical protein
VQLGLSSRRQDRNIARRELLRQVTAKLKTYDKSVQDYYAMLRLPEAHETQKHSVENWYIGNKPLVRSESSCYMNCTDNKDYIALTTNDTDRAGLDTLLDKVVKMFPNVAKHVSPYPLHHNIDIILADSPYTKFLDIKVNRFAIHCQ